MYSLISKQFLFDNCKCLKMVIFWWGNQFFNWNKLFQWGPIQGLEWLHLPELMGIMLARFPTAILAVG